MKVEEERKQEKMFTLPNFYFLSLPLKVKQKEARGKAHKIKQNTKSSYFSW